MNIKKCISLILVTFTLSSIAQEDVKMDSISLKTKTETFFELTYIQPIPYGDNFINAGYDVLPTVELGIVSSINSISIHFNFSVSSGDVVRPELVGNVRSTNINRVSVGVGYPIEVLDKLVLHPAVHIGYLKLGQNFTGGRNGRSRVLDNGSFIGLQIRGHYRILPWLDVTGGAQNNFHFLNIRAPSAERDFFRNAYAIVPSFGLRFRLGYGPREKGEPGDGIFSRKDGL